MEMTPDVLRALALQLHGQAKMMTEEAPKYVKDAADNFVKSLTQWADEKEAINVSKVTASN